MKSTLPLYLQELIADIIANGGLQADETLDQALSEAHSRRQEFALEMAGGQTDRAKKARRVLAAQIYGLLAVKRTLEQIEKEEAESSRLQFVRVEDERIRAKHTGVW